MAEIKTFYFFIEKELCYLTEVDPMACSIAITMNLVEFSFHGQLTKNVYKIFANFPDIEYDEEKMTRLYKEAENYIKQHFIKENMNKIFIGCVRDDNGKYENLTKEKLGFECRTDPIYDIFNVLKQIYLNKNVVYNGKNHCLTSIKTLAEKIKESQISLTNVEYNNPETALQMNSIGKICIPKSDVQLENFMNPLKKLFENNYFETLLENIEKFKKPKPLLEFIISLKKLYNFQEETINKSIKDEDSDKPCIGKYKKILAELEKYEFQNSEIRCLKSLRRTMNVNIEFLKDHRTSFAPILFSTQMIAAENGYLRCKSLNSTPSKSMLVQWFKDTKKNQARAIKASSEFGHYDLKFKALPILERINIDIEDENPGQDDNLVENFGQLNV